MIREGVIYISPDATRPSCRTSAAAARWRARAHAGMGARGRHRGGPSRMESERNVTGWMVDKASSPPKRPMATRSSSARRSIPNSRPASAADVKARPRMRCDSTSAWQSTSLLRRWRRRRMYRAADIRWQIDSADQASRPSAKLRDPGLRVPIDESYMKKVMKKYPGHEVGRPGGLSPDRQQAVRRLGGAGRVSGEGGGNLLEVCRRASAVAQGSRGAVQSGMALLGADRDLPDRQPGQEGGRCGGALHQHREETDIAIPRCQRLGHPRRYSDIHGADQHSYLGQ